MSTPIDRRRFLEKTAVLGAAAAGLGLSASSPDGNPRPPAEPVQLLAGAPANKPYRKPNVILVRFGGGVRRQETILDAEHTWCPFIYHELFQKKGVLLANVEIESAPGVETSHGQGTLYLLTGKYDRYEDIERRFLSDRFEPKVPTVFEYLRHQYAIPPHQALIVNGEDRINEEFYTFSNCRPYGIDYRSTVLSLYRFKTFVLRDELAHGRLVGGRRVPLSEEESRDKRATLRRMSNLDYRSEGRDLNSPELDRFWHRWRDYYGTSGLVNPRGDRVLTALALRALRELRPKLMMINYQDPDYVHWGNRNFYFRSISVIDEGVRELYNAVQADEEYRDNTVFLIVPDCGRDSSRCMPVPYQHHFNTRSAHEVFVVAAGPGIAHSRTPVARARPHQQCSVAATLGRIMGFPTPLVAAGSLAEVFA